MDEKSQDLKDAPEAATATQAPSVAGSAAVRGASLLIILQVLSRAATFVANQALLRFVTAQLLGVSTQLEVYYLSVLFFGRESLRVAIQRGGMGVGGGKAKLEVKKSETETETTEPRTKAATTTEAQRSQSAVNLAYVSVALGSVVALLLGWLYLKSVEGSGGSSSSSDSNTDSNIVATTPFLRPALYLYAAAAVAELLAEPAFVVLQLRLQFGARAAAEATATALRCAVTLGSAVAGARRGLDLGVLPFALGQLGYGMALLGVYAAAGTALARREGFSLLPRGLTTAGDAGIGPRRGAETRAGKGQQNRATEMQNPLFSLFDRPTLRLAASMAAQSVVKHLLTQGDTFLVSILSTPTAQGVYALANNYGSLAARLLFQPIEESSRSYFSRLLSGDETETDETGRDGKDGKDEKAGAEARKACKASTAARDLLALFRLYGLFSLIVIALGPPAAAPFLGLVTGARWSAAAAEAAAATLAAYLWCLPLLAVNGVAEAFVASVAREADVHAQSASMAVFSLVFAAAGFVVLRLLHLGAVGLVLANAVNMACRIAWSLRFITRYFAAVPGAARTKKTVPFSLADAAPHPLTVLAAAVAGQAARRLAGAAGGGASFSSSSSPLDKLTQLAAIAAVGLPLVAAIAFFERAFLRQCYGFVRAK